MTGLGDVSEIHVPRRLVTVAMLHLRDVGRRGFEGLALWAGVKSEKRFEVTDTIVPKQQAIRSRSGVCVTIPPEELHRLNVWLYEKSRRLIAQIHSHPTDAYHSDTDDEFAIATTVGCLSLVVPNFAREPFTIETTAIYRLSADARWEGIPTAAAKRLITLTA